MNANRGLRAWARWSAIPGGRWLFARIAHRGSPFAARFRPRYSEVRPGRVVLELRKRRALEDDSGAIHPLALCEAAALAAGTTAAITIPLTHRWSLKGITAEWLHPARTHVRVVAELDLLPALGDAADVPIGVSVTDAGGEAVLRLTTRLRVLRGAR